MQMKMGLALSLALAVVVVAFQNFDTVAKPPLHVYVSPNGVAGGDGLSASRPLRSLSHARYLLEDYFIKRALPHRDVIIHVAPGRYSEAEVSWNFHLPRNFITIMGEDPANPPVFDGGGLPGQKTWLKVSRGDLRQSDPFRLVVRQMRIQNFHTAIKIWGAGNGYSHSPGGVVVQNMKFYNIGKAFDEPKGANSHAAIYIQGSHGNQIRWSRFYNITNDVNFAKSYDTGGLHAVYVNHSLRTLLYRNHFEKVYARGVIKFRNFSHYSRIEGNTFLDDTSLLQDDFINEAECAAAGTICMSYKQQECASYGLKWIGNRYKYLRSTYRPTVDLNEHPETLSFCESEDYFTHYGLNRADPFNYPHRYYRRLYEDANVHDPRL
jgi:hypothetical protein